MNDWSPRERITALRNAVGIAEGELAVLEGRPAAELWAEVRRAPLTPPEPIDHVATSARATTLLRIARAKRELGDAVGTELAARLGVMRASEDGDGESCEELRALAAVALAEAGRGEAEQWLGAPAARVDGVVWQAWARLHLGHLDAAYELAVDAIARGTELDAARARLVATWSALLRGRPAVADVHLHGLEELLPRQDARAPRADAAAIAALTAAMRGDTDLVQPALQRASELAVGTDLDVSSHVDGVAAWVLTLQGQPTQARTLAQRAQRGLPAAPTLERVLPALIEAEAFLVAASSVVDVAGTQMATLLAEGRRVVDKVRRATQSMGKGSGLETQARRIAAELDALFGMHATTRALTELEAIASAAESPSKLEQARALTAVAQVRGRLGDPTASAWRKDAAARAVEAGALALAQRLEQRAEQSARSTLATEVKSRELELLLEVGRAISSMLELDPLLDKIMDALIEVLTGERGFLMLYDEPQPRTGAAMPGAALRVRVARNMGGEAMTGAAELSQSVVDEARRSGEPVIVNDAGNDDRFANKASVMLLNLRSVLCLPLRTNARDFGIVYVENRSLSEIFGPRHLDLVRPLTAQAALAIDNAFAYQRNQKLYEETLSVARARERILNHVSHELKTPIAIVSGALKMVGKRLADDERMTRSIVRAERNIQRLIDIQQHMLDIYEARHGSGDDGDRPRRLALAPLLREVIDASLAEAPERTLELVVDIAADLQVVVPPGSLRSSFAGILRNAIENTPDEGRVEVHAAIDVAGAVAIVVRDFGVGITTENVPHLFEGFFHTQATERYSSKRPFEFDAGGKGLDLLRIRAMAERNGWDLSLTSTRCRFIPSDADTCPGRISACAHCSVASICHDNGGTEVRLVVPAHGPIASDGDAA